MNHPLQHPQHFFRKMKGLCFNCLAKDHNVASCRSSTRCWRCRCFGHISTECPSRCPKQLPFSVREAKQRRQKGHKLGGVQTLTHNTRGVCAFVNDSLLYLGHNSPPTAHEKSLDPMLLETLLIDQMHDIRGDSTTLFLTATPSLVVNHLPTEDWLG
jgi:hypothetical protein